MNGQWMQFMVTLLSGSVADMVVERELTAWRKAEILVAWAAISAAAVALTPAPQAEFASSLMALVAAGRVAAWGARQLVLWVRVAVASRRALRTGAKSG